MNVKFSNIIMILIFISSNMIFAQKIKNGDQLDIEGLTVSFHIISKDSRDVKGNSFDRYKVVLEVKNNTGKSFNIRNATSQNMNDAVGLIELNCINATGARLTSKRIRVGLKSHILKVNYWTRDKDGKSILDSMNVIAGYYLEPGDKVMNEAIFLIPHGEEPDLLVRKL